METNSWSEPGYVDGIPFYSVAEFEIAAKQALAARRERNPLAAAQDDLDAARLRWSAAIRQQSKIKDRNRRQAKKKT